MSKIIQQVISIGLTVWLLSMSYFETGPNTTIILVLIAETLKLQEYLNTANTKNMEGIASILEKGANTILKSTEDRLLKAKESDQ